MYIMKKYDAIIHYMDFQWIKKYYSTKNLTNIYQKYSIHDIPNSKIKYYDL